MPVHEPHPLLAGLRVDHDAPVPVYYQLQEAVRDRLAGGLLAAGTRLPTEREVAQALGVSRMTVRRALARLEREGLLVRRQGDGTYVAEPKVESGVRFLSGFTAELAARGHRTRTRVLDRCATRPDAVVARLLDVPDTGETAIRLQRVRLLDGTPITLETAWLPAATCHPILGLDLHDRSLYEVLAEVAGVRPAHAVERLTATVLDDFEAGHLDRPAGSAAFLVERTTTGSDGRPMEHVRTLLRADRFAFTTELELAPAPADLLTGVTDTPGDTTGRRARGPDPAVGPLAGTAGSQEAVGPLTESAGGVRGGGRTEGPTEGRATGGRQDGKLTGAAS